MGSKIKSAFRGIRYAAKTALAFANGAVRRIGRARYASLVVITLALFLYLTPYAADALQCVRGAEQAAAQRYVADALQCVRGAEQAAAQREDREDRRDISFRQCLGKTYDQARQDTNLAAIIIALALILAALRPGQDTAS